MSVYITLNLPTQFHLACILYQIPPQQFLQTLISHIILPSEHLNLDQQTLLATDYFLEYAALNPSPQHLYTKAQQDFLHQKHAQYQRLLQNAALYTTRKRSTFKPLL